MYKKNIYSLFPIISALVGFFSLGLSVAFLETGVYSSELFIYTEPTGSAARYIFAICGFLVAYFFVFNLIVNKKWITNQGKIINKRNDELFYKIISLTGLGIAILYLTYIPRETVESRNLYLINHPAFLRDLIHKYLPFAGLYLGLAAGFTKSVFTKITTQLSLLLIIISLYFYGHKASAFISFLSIFAISYLSIKTPIKKKHSFSKIYFSKEIIVVYILFISFVVAGTIRFVNIANYDMSDYLKNRLLCLQGGIWWITDYLKFYTKNEININNFIEFTNTSGYSKNVSICYLMEKAIGEELTNKISSIHFNIYTGGFPASFYIFGKEGPFVLSFITGVISAIACGCLIRKIIRRQYILLIFYVYLYLYIIAISESGEFLQILSTKFTLYLLVVFLAEYFLYKIYFKRVMQNPKACIQ